MGWAVDVMVANGTDETMAELQAYLPKDTRFVAHGTRISIGLLSSEMLHGQSLEGVAREAAMDVSLWDQRGCLSPVVWFVEENTKGVARRFAQLLQEALDSLRTSLPVGETSMEAAVGFMAVGDESWVRQVGERSVQVIGENIHLSRERAFADNTHRRLQVFPISNWQEVLHGMAGWHGRVSTATLAASPSRREEIMEVLAPVGITRICVPGEAQSPSITWHQDGIPPLKSLI